MIYCGLPYWGTVLVSTVNVGDDQHQYPSYGCEYRGAATSTRSVGPLILSLCFSLAMFKGTGHY